jgi:heterodisulfide reductase subunit A
VVTLPEFKALVEGSAGPLVHNGRPVESIAYIYCVGSRQPEGNRYCSRYCCTAAIHASLEVSALTPAGPGSAGTEAAKQPTQIKPPRQYHLYRDIRSYGKYEILYNEAREKGDLFLRFPDDEPPVVGNDPAGKGLLINVRDLLTEGQELTIPVDLVVLATGMVPRENEDLVRTLKLPVGNDGFFNEIHPKLRPVETVVDGVFICGACQSPKNSSEAVTAGLAAVTQSAALLKRGYAELDPLVAMVDHEKCTWCGKCLEACPYTAPGEAELDGKTVAVIDKAACKGCGGCVPVCPMSAIDLEGYTDAQIRAMIDGLFQEVASC